MAASSAHSPQAAAPVLYVLRHAKAGSRASEGSDHERVLESEGRRDARAVGRALTHIDELPDRIVCSSAARTLETAHLARTAGGWEPEPEAQTRLYGAAGREIAAALAELGHGRRVLLVGHEPSLSELIGLLTGAEVAFPTAAVARIDLAIEGWSAIAPRKGRLVWLLTPAVFAARPRPRRA